jgi:hypothetical protein
MSTNGFLPNLTFLQKADMALSDLTSGGGILQPETAQKFMRILIDESVVMKLATVVPMKSFKMEVPKIRFANRILRAGQEGVALAQGDRAKPNLTNVELDAALFKAEVRLPNEVLEDNIERDQLKQTIMQLMGEAISRDMDEVGVQGNPTSSDPFLANLPAGGILLQATSNVLDAQSQTLNKNVLKNMLKSMPTPFLRNSNLLKFLTHNYAEIDYRDTIASRQTPGGDTFLLESGEASYSGIPVMRVPLFPTDIGTGSNTTDVILSDPKNVTFGIWREIRLETDKDVSAGVVIIVASLRFDVRFAEQTAVVKAINVQVTA